MTKPQLTDRELLSLLIIKTELGQTLSGSYKTVMSELVPEVSFSHFRGLQLARVGRLWETVYNRSFMTLCPDLINFGSDWVGV